MSKISYVIISLLCFFLFFLGIVSLTLNRNILILESRIASIEKESKKEKVEYKTIEPNVADIRDATEKEKDSNSKSSSTEESETKEENSSINKRKNKYRFKDDEVTSDTPMKRRDFINLLGEDFLYYNGYTISDIKEVHNSFQGEEEEKNPNGLVLETRYPFDGTQTYIHIYWNDGHVRITAYGQGSGNTRILQDSTTELEYDKTLAIMTHKALGENLRAMLSHRSFYTQDAG